MVTDLPPSGDPAIQRTVKIVKAGFSDTIRIHNEGFAMCRIRRVFEAGGAAIAPVGGRPLSSTLLGRPHTAG